MARIRTIKPEFWTDEKIVQLPYEARLLFIGMWNFCDDEGYLWNEPERIRMQVLPNDDVDISGIIDLLSASGFIETYITDDDKRYIRIAHFSDHQKVDHPTKSKISREGSRKFTIPSNVRRLVAKKYGCKQGESIDVECYYCGSQGKINWLHTNKGKPNPWVSFSNLELDHLHPESKGGETTVDNIVLSCRECNRSKHNKDLFNFVVNTREDSRTLAPEGKGREGNSKGKEDNPFVSPFPQKQDEVVDVVSPKAQQKKSNGTRLPDDFSVPEEWIAWAIEARNDLTASKIRIECEKFIDYWHSAPGAKARKTDWQATWRNWIRNCNAQAPPAQPNKFKKYDPLNSIYGGDGFGNKRDTESRIIDIDGSVAYEEPKIQKLISH